VHGSGVLSRRQRTGRGQRIDSSMHLINKALHAARTTILAALVTIPSTLAAQNAAFKLDGAEVVPGEELSLLLWVSLDQPIRGFQLGVEFPSSQVDFL